MVEELVHRQGRTVITNSLGAAVFLAGRGGYEVRLLGGRLDHDVPATYGDEALAEISRLRVEWASVSPVSFNAESGAMHYVWHEAAMAPRGIQVCAPSDGDVLVTDSGADVDTLRAVRHSAMTGRAPPGNC